MALDVTSLSLGSLEIPKLEAVIELMYLAACADGVVVSEERALFKQHVLEATHGAVSETTAEAMISAISQALDHDGREERLAQIRQRLGDPRLRRAALVTAIQVLRADQVVNPSESSFLLRAATALEIPSEEALELLRQSYTTHQS